MTTFHPLRKLALLALVALLSSCTSSAPSQSGAETIIGDLQATLSPHYAIVDSGSRSLWWFDKDGLATSITSPQRLSVILTKTAAKNYSVTEIDTAPELITAIQSIKSTMTAHGFSPQPFISPAKQPFRIFTVAYFNEQTSVRCRLEVIDPNSGIGETAPFTYQATVLCGDDVQYQAAHDKQIPFLKGLASELGDDTIYVLEEDMVPGVCGDPSLTRVTIDAADGSMMGLIRAMKKTDTGWIDSGFSPAEIDQGCPSVGSSTH